MNKSDGLTGDPVTKQIFPVGSVGKVVPGMGLIWGIPDNGESDLAREDEQE